MAVRDTVAKTLEATTQLASLQIEVSTLAQLTSLLIVLALHVAVTVVNHLPALKVSPPASTDIATAARPASFTVTCDNSKFSYDKQLSAGFLKGIFFEVSDQGDILISPSELLSDVFWGPDFDAGGTVRKSLDLTCKVYGAFTDGCPISAPLKLSLLDDFCWVQRATNVAEVPLPTKVASEAACQGVQRIKDVHGL